MGANEWPGQAGEPMTGLAAAFGYILMNTALTMRARLTLAMSGYNHQHSSTHRAHQLDHRLRVPRAVPKA